MNNWSSISKVLYKNLLKVFAASFYAVALYSFPLFFVMFITGKISLIQMFLFFFGSIFFGVGLAIFGLIPYWLITSALICLGLQTKKNFVLCAFLTAVLTGLAWGLVSYSKNAYSIVFVFAMFGSLTGYFHWMLGKDLRLNSYKEGIVMLNQNIKATAELRTLRNP